MVMMIWTLYLTLAGSILGSFYNVVGVRVPLRQPLLFTRSACPACRRSLKPLELIPVLSYFLQKGRCTSCKATIPLFYPVMEILTACLFAFSLLTFGFSYEFLIALLLISLLVIVVVSDICFMLIPNVVLLCFTLPLVALRLTLAPLDPWFDPFLGAVLVFSLLLFVSSWKKDSLGGGDIKLLTLLGFTLGTQQVLLAIAAASFLGALVGGVFLLARKRSPEEPFPFAPFIAIGTLFVYFFGEALLSFQLSPFLF
ncbi:prepilin peptidase [Shouchella shacheensis]|uniref:prepilin peptidase n=1 Tax=Shouchella shacheensis TaxID=1649580 RepID=UPI00074028AA|nr:A24 family peptidase [Shouchella shacheensis]